MLEPEKVRDIITEMKKTISIPITVKCRIGVDRNTHVMISCRS